MSDDRIVKLENNLVGNSIGGVEMETATVTFGDGSIFHMGFKANSSPRAQDSQSTADRLFQKFYTELPKYPGWEDALAALFRDKKLD